MKLAELHSDLKIQEKDELSWKKLKAEGLDEDGEKEAKLRRNLNGKVYLCRRDLNCMKCLFRHLCKCLNHLVTDCFLRHLICSCLEISRNVRRLTASFASDVFKKDH